MTEQNYQPIEQRIASANEALESGSYFAAGREVFGGWRELGRLYNDVRNTGAPQDRVMDYNAQLTEIEGKILARGGKKALSTTYFEGKRLATKGLEAMLGEDRVANLKEDTRDYAAAVKLGAHVVASDAKQMYGAAKTGVGVGLGKLGSLLDRASKKLNKE